MKTGDKTLAFIEVNSKCLEVIARLIPLALSESLPNDIYEMASTVLEKQNEYDDVSIMLAGILLFRHQAAQRGVSFGEFIRFSKRKKGAKNENAIR